MLWLRKLRGAQRGRLSVLGRFVKKKISLSVNKHFKMLQGKLKFVDKRMKKETRAAKARMKRKK